MTLSFSKSAATAAISSAGRLCLQGITKTFNGSGDHVLENIDLTCEPGQFVVVVGPSGSGKSTLLNIAAGMIKPDGGSASLDGKDITGPGPERAMVFQDHGLFPGSRRKKYRIRPENVGHVKIPAHRRVAEALASVHLINSGDKLVARTFRRHAPARRHRARWS